MRYYNVKFKDSFSRIIETIIVRVDEFLGIDENEIEEDLIDQGYDPQILETQEISLIEAKRIECDNYNCYWV